MLFRLWQFAAGGMLFRLRQLAAGGEKPFFLYLLFVGNREAANAASRVFSCRGEVTAAGL